MRDEPADPTIRVLLVDDDAQAAQAIASILQRRGFAVRMLHDPIAAHAHLREHHDAFDVIVLDVDMPGMTGLELLARIRHLDITSPVVMLTGDAGAGTATKAMRAGAFMYMTKPVIAHDELVALLQSAANYGALARHARVLERTVAVAARPLRPLGESAGMRQLHARIERLGPSDVSILVLGESGTGKELIARALHAHSARADKPFVAINCGAIAESMIDSELFGHSRGAFTGAVAARLGVFVEADGGTLFLDEIGEMPLAVQARLLRVLQEREVRAIGAEGVRHIDVRVIAATHADLDEAVADKRFRADLYYRLDVARIEVPPLRARMSDVPLLVSHFLNKHGSSRHARFTPAAFERLMGYPWPGNVRELENAVLHALALTAADTIEDIALPRRIVQSVAEPAPAPRLSAELDWANELSLAEAKKRVVDDFERAYVYRAMVRADGKLAEAARVSGLDRSNFRRVMTRLGLDPDSFRKL